MSEHPPQEWLEKVYGPFRAARGERQEAFRTASGLDLEPCYFPSAVARTPEGPGEYPFTRGVHPTMYRGRHWTMRQYAGFSSAQETNARFRYLLEQGQTGLSVAFDLPTQIGYDSDHPLAAAEAGKVGVAINSLRDFEQLFDGIPLGQVSTSMTINATALVLFSMYVALAKRQDVPAERILGTVQNDILKEFAARGNYRFDVEPSMRLTTDLFRFQQEVAPRFNAISVSGYHMREAGCSAVQEVAFTLGDGVAYLEAARAAGLDVAATARRISFFFNGHNELFEEVAKFRAARRLWARIVKERFGVDDPRAQMLRFHTQTGGSTLTSQQPLVNSVRVTVQALAAVLGGTQSLHTNSMDETLSLPTEKAVKIALRTQQVIAEEIEVAHVADPLGGSYFVEAMTDRLEAEAEAYFTEIERRGGVVPSIDAGYFQKEIHDSAVSYQRAVERGRKRVVGVNCYTEGEEELEIELHRIRPEVEQEARANLARLRAERDPQRAEAALQAIRTGCHDGSNLLERFVAAAHADCTLGEIAQVLREEFGEYVEPKIL